ncbi:MAG: hypothetical protein HOP19_15440 [Acidobacteria bacterium]|nr:hypothetical protein [Acidobacteriota bacterium]
MTRSKEVTIERHELTIVRSGQFRALPVSPQRGGCSVCEQEALWLAAEAAAIYSGLSRREIYRRIENGTLHFQEMTDGIVQVCLTSLAGTDP